jgi:6-phosphogluconolactonase
MSDRLTLDVYSTDAEAFDAAAALAAEHLRAAAAGRHAAVALAGGRGGRGVMLALAAREDVPWDRVEWCFGDERCVPARDSHSNAKLAEESLLGPRRVPAERIHVPPVELEDPERIAAAYAETLRSLLGPDLAFDLILLGMGPDGHVASLTPGSAALSATTPVATVRADELHTEPRVARVTLTPPVLRAARHVIVTVTGGEKAAAVAAALADDGDVARCPARLVRPSARVSWVADRAAVADLLKTARPAQ